MLILHIHLNITESRIKVYNKLGLSKLDSDPEVRKQFNNVGASKSGISVREIEYKLRRMTEIAVDNLKNLMDKYKDLNVITNMQCKPDSEGKEVSCVAIVKNSSNDIYASIEIIPAIVDDKLYAIMIKNVPSDDLRLRYLIVTVKEGPSTRFEKMPFNLEEEKRK